MGSVAIPSSGGGGFGKTITRTRIGWTNSSGAGWLNCVINEMPESGSVTFTKSSGGGTCVIYKNGGSEQTGTVSFNKGDTLQFTVQGANSAGSGNIVFASDLEAVNKTIGISWGNSSGSMYQNYTFTMKKKGYAAYSTNANKPASAAYFVKNGTTLNALSTSFEKGDTIRFYENISASHNSYVDWLY